MTDHHNIRPAIADRAVPIDQLDPHPLNARQRDARAEAELRDSLTTNGQYRAIVTRQIKRRGGKTRLQVLAGHGTLEAARQLGWTHIAAEQHTDVICRRWQEHTGVLPTREDGTPVDFTTKAR